MTGLAPLLQNLAWLVQNPIFRRLLKFVLLTRDYAFDTAGLFLASPLNRLAAFILVIAILYSVLFRGLVENWKLLVGAFIVALILSAV